ncbi:hydrolase [Bradyrhizobium sp. STM 3566]|uniref:hydrolase n=1 Tax=Bradyrhizobium sp. STM 3566 TaxID=578928 RepID=UPI00388F5444
MKLSRRTILQGVGSLPFAVASLRTAAIAQTAPGATPNTDVPPILFVHGNGDYDALWMTTLWRMESNGVARERMMAINFTDPLARSDDKLEQAGRSSTEDQRRELAAAIAELKRRTGAARVALVGSSRGGYAIRNVIKNGGAGDVSHAVLCGTPNHGVFATDDQPNNEFNGRGTFLRSLNEGESEVTPGVAFLTLRSDGLDKYAQPDGRFIGKPGTPTNVNAEGPELRGATNLVLGALDHREVAFHPRAFREIYKFIAGREPARIAIVPETNVRLSGLVTGTPGGVSTNRPVAGATVDIFRVDPETGERMGSAVHSTKTGADGRWGPAQVEPSWSLEFVLAAPDAPITQIYRSPFPRSSDVVHLRPARPIGPADKDAGAVVIMSRPRGYFGLPRDVVLFDGREPADVKPGVPTDATATLRLPASEVGRNIVAQFGEERIVARTWPAAENRIAIAELTY